MLNICVCGTLMRPITITFRSDGASDHEDVKYTKKESKPPDGDRSQNHSQQNLALASFQNKSHQNLSTPQNRSLRNLATFQSRSLQSLANVQDRSLQSLHYVPRGETEEKQGLCNMKILKNRDYVVLMVENIVYAFGFSIVYVHLSAYAGYRGFTDYQGAMLFTVMGFTNTFARLLFGLLAQLPFLSSVVIYAICISCSGLVTFMCPSLVTYNALMTYAGMFGFISASWGTLLPLVIVDILGPDMLTSGYGYILLCDAIGTAIGPPVAGQYQSFSHFVQ